MFAQRFTGLLVVVAAIASVCNAQKVPVHVYYEALCPDSQAFITEQLYPVFSSGLAKYVDLTLVPFGKSNFSTHGSDVLFTCHHGPNECYANKIQSCAINHIQVDSFQSKDTRESKTVDYVNCLMKMGNNFPDSIYPGKKCAEELRINNYQNIESCANSTEGSGLLQKNGELTGELKPKLYTVPTITFKHLFDTEAQALSLSNFRVALCKQISGPMPAECKTSPSSASSISASFVMGTIALLTARLF